jgi:hypothetical protein
MEVIMENKTQIKKTNVPFVVFSSIFGALALSAIVFFHLWGEVEWVKLYLVAMRWLVLPILSLVVGYTATINKAPKGLIWLAPVILGFGISLVEWATYGSFSIVLLGLGALAALFGFTFAKMDRKEKAREARKAAKKAGAAAEDTAKPKAAFHDDEYNPGADFVPDDDDTWADEILAEEGYGEIKVDYAESDPDFTIDSPDAVNEEDEASAKSEDDEAITDTYDTDDVMPEDGDVENVESTPEGDESEEEPAEALDGDVDEADGDDAADVDADEPSDDKGEEANTDETDVVDDSSSDDSETVNE